MYFFLILHCWYCLYYRYFTFMFFFQYSILFAHSVVILLAKFYCWNCQYKCVSFILDKLAPEKVTLCERQVRHLECPADYHLRINTVFYGRNDKTTCPNGLNTNNTNCPSVPSLEIKMRTVCDGRPSCWFEALSRIWGDNCNGTSKVGITEYTCQCEF